MSMIAHTYVQHNNSVDLHRDSLLACLLYVLKRGAPTRPKPLSMEALSNVCDEHLVAARKLKPGTLVPPVAACNYRMVEGQLKHRKKRTNNSCIKIHHPTEKQTIKMFVDSCRQCENLHLKRNDSSEFGAAYDAVVTSLMKKGAMNFEISLEKIPHQMSCIQPSTSSEIVGMKRKCIVLMSDGDSDVVETSTLPGQSSASPTARPGSTLTVQPMLSQGAIPITVAIPSKKEKVILQSRRQTTEPEPKPDLPTQEKHGEENNVIDDQDSSSDSGSGSSSGSESDGENEDRSRRSLWPKERSTPMASRTRPCMATDAERDKRHLRLSPLNTLAEAMALDLPNPVIPRRTLTLLSR